MLLVKILFVCVFHLFYGGKDLLARFGVDKFGEGHLRLTFEDEQYCVLQLFVSVDNCFPLLDVTHIEAVKKFSLVFF